MAAQRILSMAGETVGADRHIFDDVLVDAGEVSVSDHRAVGFESADRREPCPAVLKIGRLKRHEVRVRFCAHFQCSHSSQNSDTASVTSIASSSSSPMPRSLRRNAALPASW